MKFDSGNPFKLRSGNEDPPPLVMRLTRKIRFGECDPMGVVWHGNYAVYFEEAREALAEACGINYPALKAHGFLLPIKTMFVDYCLPLTPGRSYRIEALMRWTEAARVNLEYRIEDARGEVCTKGFSVQLMTDLSGSLLLDPPPLYRAFAENWRAGRLNFLQTTVPRPAVEE